MLSEAFGDLLLADEDVVAVSRSEEKRCDIEPSEYRVLRHSPKWFIDPQLSVKHDDGRELAFYRAGLSYDEGNFEASMKNYQEMLEAGDHKDSYKFAIVDSVIRCGLKISSTDPSVLLDVLHNRLRPLVSTYGEQLQYWSLSLLVYKRCKTISTDYLRNSILLCATVDCAEHWTLLSDAHQKIGNANFRVGCLTRAVCLIRRRLDESRGFMKDLSERKTNHLEKELDALFPSELIKEAKAQLCSDIRRKDNEEGDSRSFPPPYDCRVKGLFKNQNEENSMISQFVLRFQWLFEGEMDKISNLLRLPSI